MREILDSLKNEIEDHRSRMAEIARRPFPLGDRWVRVMICPERRTASAWTGCLHLSSRVCNETGARELAEAIVAESDIEWRDCGFEVTHIVSLAMGIL